MDGCSDIVIIWVAGQASSVTKELGLSLTRQDRGAREYKTKEKNQRLPPYPANAIQHKYTHNSIVPVKPTVNAIRNQTRKRTRITR